MKRRALDIFGSESRWEELFDRYPGGRPATPEEVADLMLFLASPRAAYITGTIVTIACDRCDRAGVDADDANSVIEADAAQRAGERHQRGIAGRRAH
jgi:hypothetical protein